MNKRSLLLFCGSLLLVCTSFAQGSLVNVNTLTGAANVVLPVYSFTRDKSQGRGRLGRDGLERADGRTGKQAAPGPA
jgi:hypothetical protein